MKKYIMFMVVLLEQPLNAFELTKTDIRGFPNSLVDPVDVIKTKQEDILKRACLSGGARYAKHFEDFYDNYPKALQKMFCSLKYLFIEKKFFGTAYAGDLRDKDGKRYGAMMGVRLNRIK